MMHCHRLVCTFSTLIVSRKRNPSFSQFTVPGKLGERNRNPNPIPIPHRTIPTMSIGTYPEKRAQRPNDEVIAMFESWLVRHGKSYNTLGEKERRFEIFKERLRIVDEHNADMNRSYSMGLNQFSDWTNEEYQSMCCSGTKMHEEYQSMCCSGTKMSDQGCDWNERNDGGTGFIIDNDGINTEEDYHKSEKTTLGQCKSRQGK